MKDAPILGWFFLRNLDHDFLRPAESPGIRIVFGIDTPGVFEATGIFRIFGAGMLS
jgi:hypothetical protein